jgi:hypothetical protein
VKTQDTTTTLKRIQFDLPEKSMQRLLALKSKTESSSYAEVVKNALRLYEAVIEQSEAGNTFLLKDQEGNLREYAIF